VTSSTSSDFAELPQHRLAVLDDDELIDYLRRAREAGRHDAMKPAVAILVFGHWDNLVNRARLKLRHEDAQDVAAEAVSSAIASAFDGSSIGEFRSWLHTILSRRIADWWEAMKRKVETVPLPGEGADEDDRRRPEPGVRFEGEALHARDCVRRAVEELEERHREVVELHVLGPHSAAEAARLAGDGMTDANVHQIASRFQRRVRQLIESDTSD
jgi:RNA polymerase sigma factor (sigma-70 family)